MSSDLALKGFGVERELGGEFACKSRFKGEVALIADLTKRLHYLDPVYLEGEGESVIILFKVCIVDVQAVDMLLAHLTDKRGDIGADK